MEQIFGLIAILFLCLTATTCQPNDLSKATSKFALDILKANGNSYENAIFSPASISMCVGMAYVGANGTTKSQISAALYDGIDDQSINEQMKSLSENLNQRSSSYNLSLANRLYAQNNFDILQTYLDTLQRFYGIDIKSVDFVHKAESVRQDINTWVENKTNMKIVNLIPPGGLSGAVLALINAVYFKGDWVSKFRQEFTTKKTFYSKPDNLMDVNMMKQTSDKFYYTEDDNCQVLGLPYVGDQLTMYILLPKEKYGLREFASILTGDKFMDLVKTAGKREVEVEIPKFKLEQQFDLTAVLKSLGMTDMFDKLAADFTGIDGHKDLYVSTVIHKAFIEVNEEGSEAAAATGMFFHGMAALALPPPPPPQFIADHPFFFAIVDRRSYNPLFVGRYVGK